MLLFIGCKSINYAQCINTDPSPFNSVSSNNSGDPQEIDSCIYTGKFSTISNILPGHGYIFGLIDNGEPVEKYITVTDISNQVIAQGPTPLTVSDISSTSIRLHYSEGPGCGTEEWCLSAYLKVILPCPFPTNILIDGLTTTSATFSWVPGGSEEAWQVLVLPKGSDVPSPSTEGTLVENEPEYSTNSLETAHQYEFYIRAVCESEYSPWRGPHSFNSSCDPIAVFNENFDSVTNGELPSCWTALKVNTSPYANIGINGLSNSAPNAVQIANDSSGPEAKLLLISPNLSTVSTASHRLKFYIRGYGNSVALQVGTINTTTSAGVFNSIGTVYATANYTEHTVDFTGYSGTDTHIAFRYADPSMYNPIFIDDIRWEQAPSCPDVKDIEAIALTQTTATIGWVAGGAEPQWDVVYSDTVNDPNLLTPISPAPTDPEATITGLQADTTYKVWVRSSCGDDLGAWMNPITIRTPCNPTGTLNETFESTANGSLPQCWSAILAEDSVIGSYIRVVSNNAASGTKAVALHNGDDGLTSKIILVAPSLNTVATSTHRVKFYAKSNVAATLQVGTLDSPASGATFTSFQNLNITPSHTEYLVDFTTYTGTDNYIGFKLTSGQYFTVYLDNIRWEVSPSCIDVTNIQVENITAATASLSWNAVAGQTAWDVVYGIGVDDPNTLTPISPAPTTNPQATLSGLTDNTDYKLWVRSVCGGTDGNGAWIGPILFKTACLPKSSFTESFETTSFGNVPDCWSAVLAGPTLGQYAAVRAVNYDAAIGNNAVELHANSSEPTDLIMLVSPYVNSLASGTHRLRFYAKSSNIDTPFQIGTMNGNTSQATYTPFQSVTVETGYTEYTIDFTTYTGTDNYIVFRNVAGNYNSIFIDHVRWEVLPTCPDVVNLQVSDIEAETATATWSVGENESSWQVVYAPFTVTDPSTLTPSEILIDISFQLTGLNDNSFYNVWVRSVCDGSDGNGSWIGPVTFRTKCLPTTVPYTQNFESPWVPDMPECSTLQKIGSGNNWATNYGDLSYGFNGKVLRYSGNAFDANAWYFTQGVQLTGGSEYVISYKYGNNSSDNYVERLQVLYGNAANANSMTEEIADHAQINNGMATINEVTFVPSETGAYYFGFLAYSIANQGHLYLDDISVSASLSVPETSIKSLSYYPNPVKDVLNLSHTQLINSVTIYNMLGQKVKETAVNSTSTSIDMSDLSAGNYIAKVASNGQNQTLKIIKQ